MTTSRETGPPRLEVCGMSKAFSGVPVLRGVSLTLGRGRVLGLVGENGAGKSTLMNLLCGVHRPDSGVMTLDGRPYAPARPRDASDAGVAIIHQELNLFSNLSVAENLHIGSFPRLRFCGISVPVIDRRGLRDRARQFLGQVDPSLDPDALVADLSPGHRQLVEVARALGADARLIIFDEPTTSLSAPEAQRLFRLISRLRDQGVSMVFISHNLEDVLGHCDDVCVLRDGALVSSGPVGGYSRGRLISEMVGRDVGQFYSTREGGPSGAPLLEVRDLARPPFVNGVSFTLHSGEILGVSGLMGAGRTEMARLIFGLDRIQAGQVVLRGEPFFPTPRGSIRRGLAFLTEDRRHEGLLMQASVLQNTSIVSLPAFTRSFLKLVNGRKVRDAVDEATSAVRLRSARPARQAVRTLSGGNQQKVVLAKWILAGPSVFLLDEPTRGIDVGAKQEVYRVIEGLAGRGAGVLMISSEIEELIGMCDRIMVMAAGRLRDVLPRGEFDRERILRAAIGGRASGETDD